MTETEASQHLHDAFTLWQHRSLYPWTLDLALLTNADITPTPPPEATERAEQAAKQV